jgi:excisionase family DNA binding protein
LVVEALLKARELAKVTGISRTTLYEMAKQDRIPHVRIGGMVRFPESRVAEWLEREIRGGSPREDE